jgi:hypothetical protein
VQPVLVGHCSSVALRATSSLIFGRIHTTYLRTTHDCRVTDTRGQRLASCPRLRNFSSTNGNSTELSTTGTADMLTTIRTPNWLVQTPRDRPTGFGVWWEFPTSVVVRAPKSPSTRT